MSDGADRIGSEILTIRRLFTGRRYLLDDYQREYAWRSEHVRDLLDDLARRFLDQRRPEHETQDVASYQPYFLGPIVTFQRRGESYIVDGQQRLTTLMLLLIWLDQLQSDREDRVGGLSSLVVADHYGDLRFAVDDPIEPRQPYLAMIFAGEERPEKDISRSAANIFARFADIQAMFPDELRDDALPHFIYWLLDRVLLAEISTYRDSMALEMFETMNDRGLRLASIDLLKSFIVNEVNPALRAEVSSSWRARLAPLQELDGNGPVNFVKAWLRAKYSRHATDDDAIGGTFDKWFRQNHSEVGVKTPGQFHALVTTDMDQLSRHYATLLNAARTPVSGLDAVYFNGTNLVTLQFPLILSAVAVGDPELVFRTKAAMVAGFLDIYVARRIAGGHDFRYDSLAPTVFALAREIRGADVPTLARRLGAEIAQLDEGFDGLADYTLRYGNGKLVRYLLARMAAWVEVRAKGGDDGYAEVFRRFRAYEIEHIWANHPEYHPEVPARRFQAVRNKLGALLLLLPKSFNASYGDKTYADKYDLYFGQPQLLTQSLHENCYQNNAGFSRLVAAHDLPFQPYPGEFTENAIQQRQRLYQRLCELVWDPAQYGLTVPAAPVRVPKQRARAHFGVSVAQLVQHGLIPAGAELIGSYRGVDYRAEVTVDGSLMVESGQVFDSPSPAAGVVLDRPSWNGWTFWRVRMPDGTTPLLDALRKTALQKGIGVD